MTDGSAAWKVVASGFAEGIYSACQWTVPLIAHGNTGYTRWETRLEKFLARAPPTCNAPVLSESPSSAYLILLVHVSFLFRTQSRSLVASHRVCSRVCVGGGENVARLLETVAGLLRPDSLMDFFRIVWVIGRAIGRGSLDRWVEGIRLEGGFGRVEWNEEGEWYLTSFDVNKVKRNGSGIGVFFRTSVFRLFCQIVINNDRVMEGMKLEFVRTLYLIFWRTKSLLD